MPSLSHIINALSAAVNLVMYRAEALDRFEKTGRAFFWSFFALIIVAPVQFIGSEIQASNLPPEMAVQTTGMLVAQTLTYVLDWLIFPLVMIPVAKQLGFSGQYARYITSYNWSKAVMYAVTVPTYAWLMVNPENGIIVMVAMAITVWSLTFRAWLAKTALQTSWGIGIGIFLMDMVISLFLSLTIAQFALPAGTVTITPVD